MGIGIDFLSIRWLTQLFILGPVLEPKHSNTFRFTCSTPIDAFLDTKLWDLFKLIKIISTDTILKINPSSTQ